MFPLVAQKNGIKAVWASEIEKFPIAVSKHHFPDMKHLGDIKDICLCTHITHFSGTKCEFYINTARDILVRPVDIITFSSPCQDLSVAGKRAGLAGERSGLFSKAILIIQEMRFVTNGMYPKYAIWENVPGAFSSNKGQDFRTVLKEITASEIPMPKSGKWANAGMVRGDGYSVAWRVCDAQYWGVAQRRKRIFLVVDFGGQRAGEILFECESMSGDFAESGEAREEITGGAGDSVEKSGGIIPFDTTQITSPQNGNNPKPNAPCHPLCATAHTPATAIPIAFNGRQDPVYGAVTGAIDTDRATQCVLHPKVTGTICASGAGTNRPAGQGNETDLCIVFTQNQREEVRDLGGKVGALAAQPGIHQQTFVAHIDAYPEPANTLLAKANMSYRADVDNLVCVVDVRNLYETEELSGTLQSKNTGGYSLNYQNPVRVGYAVRRLMPIETERLMSMPDGWTDIPGASDTARYKAIGNSLVCNIAEWIFSQIVVAEKELIACQNYQENSQQKK